MSLPGEVPALAMLSLHKRLAPDARVVKRGFIRQGRFRIRPQPQAISTFTDFMPDRPYLLDASRMVWRVWTGRLPTGIDRVCLAWLEHYGPRSCALVQKGEFRLVLDPAHSDELFALLLLGGRGFRRKIAWLLARAMLLHRPQPVAGRIYLNMGHTGLDAPGLPAWLRRSALRPVFLVHDLIPVTHPEFCRAQEHARHTLRVRHMLECAHGVVANSAVTLADLEAFADAQGLVVPSRRLVSWLGVDVQVLPDSSAVPARPYFLTIGTIEARKNHLLLLHLWERLVDRLGEAPPRLVIVGQRGWEADDVFAMLDRSPKLRSSVIELGRCSDARMFALLDGAQALLMPSFVEGYGIPVIEALERGVPVIASDIPVFREIAGEIPLYLDPVDGPAWERAITDFSGDSAERRRQLALMPGFRPPTWEAHFSRIDRWLAEEAAHDPAMGSPIG